MKLSDLKDRLSDIEDDLDENVYVVLHTVTCNNRTLHVALTDMLRRNAKRARAWKTKPMLSALRNAGYGLDERSPRSRGGRDGIFIIDRHFSPKNAMMVKLFDRFLDKPHPKAIEIADSLGVRKENLLAVRLVSHNLRLLGILSRGDQDDYLVLVDVDK